MEHFFGIGDDTWQLCPQHGYSTDYRKREKSELLRLKEELREAALMEGCIAVRLS